VEHPAIASTLNFKGKCFSQVGVAMLAHHGGMKHSSLPGIIMALAAAVLWGTTGTAQSLVAAHFSPYWIGAWRLLIASVFFAMVVARSKDPLAWAWVRTAWRWVVLAGLAMAAYNLCFFAGVKAAGVATGTAVAIGSGPVWVGLLQAWFTRQSPRPVWWLGTTLAVLGIGLMFSGASHTASFSATGYVLCLAAGLAYASFTLLSKHLVGVTTPEMATLTVFTVAALIALPVAALVSNTFVATSASWLLVSYLGVVATGIAFLLFSHALRHIAAASCVTLSLAEPVTAFGLAILVVGERPDAFAFGGLALVVAGLLLVVWVETRKKGGPSLRIPTA